MGNRVNIRQTGKDAHVRYLKKLSEAGQKIEVGILETEAGGSHGEHLTLLDVAIINEFGLGVPERSFVRDWFLESRKKSLALVQAAFREFTLKEGKGDLKGKLQQLATLFAAQMQARIRARIAPENSKRTIDAKRSDVPLIDTGQLVNAIQGLVTGG